MKGIPILIDKWPGLPRSPHLKCTLHPAAAQGLTVTPNRSRPKHHHLLVYSSFLLLTTLASVPSRPLSLAYASPEDKSSIEEKVLAEQRRIDQAVVQPCTAGRQQKAKEIQQKIIDNCGCPAARQKQETDELQATLQVELQRCEQKGADALDQFKHALVTHAQDDFNRYSGQVELDRQILQNLGFQRTVDEMESWTRYGEEEQKRYIREAKKEVLGKFFQSLSLKAGEWAATPHMTTEKAVSLFNLFKATGVKDKALFDMLAATARKDPQIPERLIWVKVTDGLEKLVEGGEITHLLIQKDDQELAGIFNSVLTVASWMAPKIVPYVSIVQDATWIGYATYTHVEVAYGLHKVDRLTTLTEAQLKDMEPVTRRLKQDVDDLVEAKKVLRWAATSGYNTSLTPKPSN